MWGQIAPTTWELWWRRSPTFGLSMSFISIFVSFALELGSLLKNSGPNPGSFFVLGRGYLGNQDTFAPPPNFKVVPAPLLTGRCLRRSVSSGRSVASQLMVAVAVDAGQGRKGRLRGMKRPLPMYRMSPKNEPHLFCR